MLFCCSTLGRIIKVTQEVIDYREWIASKWGSKQTERTNGKVLNERRIKSHFRTRTGSD